MNLMKRQCQKEDLKEVVSLLNDVINEGTTLEEENPISEDYINTFDYCGLVIDNKEIIGAYLIKPGAKGHCKHISTCEYAVKKGHQQVQETLVKDSLEKAYQLGYSIMQLNTVTKSFKPVLNQLGFKTLGTIRDGFKTTQGDYENIYVLYRALDESLLECKEREDPISVEIHHISNQIQDRGIYWIVSEVKHYRMKTKREYSTFDYRDLHYQSEDDIKNFVENIFHKYYVKDELNHDTVHILSIHTSKDDAIAEWIKRDDLELQKQMTSMHSYTKGIK